MNRTHCPTTIAFNAMGKTTPIWCGSWNCPRCMVVNARLWAWRVRLHVQANGGHARFWTLTLGSRYKTATEGFRALPGLFDRFRKRVKRDVSGWSYCAFVEGQPHRGYMPHFHIVSVQSAPGRLKDIAVFCGFGYQAKDEEITDDQGAAYVAKYASKQSPFTPKGFRRVRTSQDWAKLPEGNWPKLIVRSRKETLLDFLLKVEEQTGVSIDLLYDRYELAREDYGFLQETL